MVYTLLFLSSKCSLFHNSNIFGSCIIHILYTGVLKFKKKNNSGAKRLNHPRYARESGAKEVKEGTSERRNFIHQHCSYVSASLKVRITVHVNRSVFEQEALLCTERDVQFGTHTCGRRRQASVEEWYGRISRGNTPYTARTSGLTSLYKAFVAGAGRTALLTGD